MMTSIIDDVKREFRSGTMVTKIILVNVLVFVVMALLNVFGNFPGSTATAQWWNFIWRNLTLSNDWLFNLKHFWVFFTHMNIHLGVWHILWNMLFIYWFGRRVGDLIGDKHILPLYIYGGLSSAFLLILMDNLFHYIPEGSQIFAHGASGAAMAFVVASAVINPEAELNLILIGPVKLKYVAAVLVFLDIIALGGNINTGGHFGHLGGATMGWFYVYALRNGWSLLPQFFIEKPQKRSAKLRTISPGIQPLENKKTSSQSFAGYFESKHQPNETIVKNMDDEIDRILDKIREKGMDSLTDQEKNTLDHQSKK